MREREREGGKRRRKERELYLTAFGFEVERSTSGTERGRVFVSRGGLWPPSPSLPIVVLLLFLYSIACLLEKIFLIFF